MITALALPLAASCAQLLGLDNPTLDPDAAIPAELTALEIAGQPIQPAFDPAVRAYTVDGPFFFGDAIVTASAAEGQIEVNGDSVTSGIPSEPIELALGVNSIEVDVTISGGGSARYTIEVTRGKDVLDYIKASNTDVDDQFGRAIALDNDSLVVGSDFEASNATGVNGNQSDNSLEDAGAVYVFIRAGNLWSQEAYLKASNTGASDRFGESVAIAGDTVVVGARGEDSDAVGVNGDDSNDDAVESGAAYVFVREGSTWTQQTYLKASNSEAGDFFGVAVVVDGDTVAVAATLEDSDATGVNGAETNNNALSSGAAYVFTRSGTTWTQQV